MKQITILLIAIAFSGCYTAKKAEQQVNKANEKYPELVAKLARDKYPCTDLLKDDTAVVYKDTTVYINCPDSMPATYETVRTDTVLMPGEVKQIVKTVRVPVTVTVPGKVITKWYEDESKLKLAAIERDKLIKQMQVQQKEVDDLTATNKRKGKIIRWLIFFLIGLSVPYIIKIVRMFL